MKKKTDNILIRLWQYQSERVPLFSVAILSMLTVGVIYSFAKTNMAHYIVSTLIMVLYLIQIRVSDEKKDFEHDNKFYKNRPVQRGLVTLGELYRVNQIVIATQILLYASFLEPSIFILGLLSQGYAFLTRKEFYAGKWLREHFFTYNIFHQLQLVVLFYAMVAIVQPKNINTILLLVFILANVVVVELARKTLPAKEDNANDSYSSHLGRKGDAIAISGVAVIGVLLAEYVLLNHLGNIIFIVSPVLFLGVVFLYTYHYAIAPNEKNQKGVQIAAILFFVGAMISVIFGT